MTTFVLIPRVARTLITLLLGFSAVAHAEPCKKVPTIAASFDVGLMRPGTYKLVLVATTGRKQGASAEGALSLRFTSPLDRSPRTGQLAKDSERVETPLYGWSSLDFLAVDAPVASGVGEDPAPSSRDPVYPGVLVRLGAFKDGYPRNSPVLLVSTVSNRRDGVGVLDGGGIGLWVRRLDKKAFAGEWSPWGIAMSGTGYFCATWVGP